MTKPTETAGLTETRDGSRSDRAAFTMIELFFVITIIATLIALLLPAIQSSRELARRTQCAKNLMQIGLALGNYASAHRVFPPGVVNDKGPISGMPVGYHYGWAVQILPYLELRNLYNQINFHQGVYDATNQTARVHRISCFMCPSSPIQGLTSYAACHHDVEAPIAVDNHGVFFLNSHVSLTDITDGPTCTVLVGEFRGGVPGLGWAVGTRSSLRNTGWPINATDPFSVAVSGVTRLVNNPYEVDLSEVEAAITSGQVLPSYVGGFSSYHPGVSNFLFGDGSVHSLTDRIHPHVYRSLGHRADGNLISADEF